MPLLGGASRFRPGLGIEPRERVLRFFPRVRRDSNRRGRKAPREGRERWLVPGRPTGEPQHQCGLTAPVQVESKEEGSQGAGVSALGGSKAQGTAPRRCRSCKEKLWVRMRLVTSWVRSVSPKMSS